MGEDGSTEYNFTAKLDCTFDDPAMLDEIAYKPVLGERKQLFWLRKRRQCQM